VRAMLAALVLAVTGAGALPAVGTEAAGPRPAVIAVIGERGLNPAHVEFRDTGATTPALPPHTVITLPTASSSTSFASLLAQMSAGPLGRLQPGQLYRIDGTRLLVYIPAGQPGPYNLVDGPDDGNGDYRRHGTGATGAAIGTKHGTAPDAWAVFIPGSDPSGYQWLARQDWVDVATVSSYILAMGGTADGLLPCASAPHVRTYTEDRVFFASSGNGEHSSLYLLNAMPEFYLVGGVDKEGNAIMAPRVPADPSTEEISFSAPVSTRTYESGDRYEFQVASSLSVDGTLRFGGTSGASPTTAGRSAEIITAARALLADDGTRPAAVLAQRGAGAPLPAKGPLADGVFTAAELSDVMHAVASPKLVGPARYFAEGYGAMDGAAIALAKAVLRGDQLLPARPDDDRAHEAAEAVRAQHAAARGC
jgi:hypothetical protein